MQILHMNKGEGETSYAKNSLLQKKIILVASSMVEAAIVNILWEVVSCQESSLRPFFFKSPLALSGMFFDYET
ncbi:hypothetical protein L2E82_26959 [Cichorium intybus]|uniref:Uncharacterized protein n=1 Tax=Cichorium intybus TaxID=13427 RepID=A0ACB9CRN8_CICIN|nr:hypothetical protein L2E82_26959 [Cichorium intybus]